MGWGSAALGQPLATTYRIEPPYLNLLSAHCTSTTITRATIVGPVDDAFIGGIPTGFPVFYNGRFYDKIGVSTDGFIVLGADSGTYIAGPGQAYISATDPTGCVLSRPDAAPNTIAAFNRNLYYSAAGIITVTSQLRCPNGSNTLSVVWKNARTPGSSDSLYFGLSIYGQGSIGIGSATMPSFVIAPHSYCQVGALGSDTSDHMVFVRDSTLPGQYVCLYNGQVTRGKRSSRFYIAGFAPCRLSQTGLVLQGLPPQKQSKVLAIDIADTLPYDCSPRPAAVPWRVLIKNVGRFPLDSSWLGYRHSHYLPEGPDTLAGKRVGLKKNTVKLVIDPPIPPGDSRWIDAPEPLDLSRHSIKSILSAGSSTDYQYLIYDNTMDSLHRRFVGTGPTLGPFPPFLPYSPTFRYGEGYGMRGDRPHKNKKGSLQYDSFRSYLYYDSYGSFPLTDTVPYIEMPCMDMLAYSASSDSLVFEGSFRVQSCVGGRYKECLRQMRVLVSVDNGLTYQPVSTTIRLVPNPAVPPSYRDSIPHFRADVSSLRGNIGRIALANLRDSTPTKAEFVFYRSYLREGGVYIVSDKARSTLARLEIAPNPTEQGKGIRIRFSDSRLIDEIRIVDQLGRLVEHAAPHGNELMAGHALPPGIYMVHALSSSGLHTMQRFIVN